MTSVRPKLSADTPKVVTAWDVSTGGTVYRTASGDWSKFVADAVVLSGADADQALVDAQKEETLVLDPYVMEVTANGNVSGRETLREMIRAKGPTIHPQFHKVTQESAHADT